MTQGTLPNALRPTALIGHVLNANVSGGRAEEIRETYNSLSQREWQELFSLADRRMVLPGWFLGLRARKMLPFMPLLLQEAAEAAWLLNVERNKSLVREATQVSSLLAEIGCPTVYLKGMGHILTGTHSNIGARMTGDLDVLVPRDRIQDAARHLRRRGGQFRGGIPFDVGVEPTPMSHHLPPMQMPSGVGDIELHFDFVSRRAVWPSAEDILREGVAVSADPSIFVPRPDHSIALSIAHSLSRPVALPGAEIHLKDLWDITAVYGSGTVDLNALRQALKSTQQERAFDAMLGCAEVLFGSALELGKKSERDHLSRSFLRIVLWQMASRSKRPFGYSGLQRGIDRNLRRLVLLLSHGGYRAHLRDIASDSKYRAAWKLRRAPTRKL